MLAPDLVELEHVRHVGQVDVGAHHVCKAAARLFQDARAALDGERSLQLDWRAVPGFRIGRRLALQAAAIKIVRGLTGDEDEWSAGDCVRCGLERGAGRSGHVRHYENPFLRFPIGGDGDQLNTDKCARDEEVVDLYMCARRTRRCFEEFPARLEIRRGREWVGHKLVDAYAERERRTRRLQ